MFWRSRNRNHSGKGSALICISIWLMFVPEIVLILTAKIESGNKTVRSSSSGLRFVLFFAVIDKWTLSSFTEWDAGVWAAQLKCTKVKTSCLCWTCRPSTCEWVRSLISSVPMSRVFVSLQLGAIGVFHQGDHDHVNAQTNYGPWQRLTTRLILCRGILVNWIRLLTGA